MKSILTYIESLFEPGDYVEVRTINPAESRTTKDFGEAAAWAFERSHKHNRNSYVCLSSVAGPRSVEAASKENVLLRRAYLVDIDPERQQDDKKVMSTEAEKESCLEVIHSLRYILEDTFGWPAPGLNDSGSGYQLLYKTDGHDPALPEWPFVLKWLGTRCSTEQAHVDTTVGDPSRVHRLPGTWNRKGESTEERPHRLALVVQPIPQTSAVTADMVRKVAAYAGYVPFVRDSAYEGSVDLDEIMSLFESYPQRMVCAGANSKGSMDFIYFARCPFPATPHVGTPARLVVRPTSVGFKCFHETCPANREGLSFRDLLKRLRKRYGWGNKLTRNLHISHMSVDELERELWAPSYPKHVAEEPEEEELTIPEPVKHTVTQRPRPEAVVEAPKALHVPVVVTIVEEEPKPIVVTAAAPTIVRQVTPAITFSRRLFLDFETRSEIDITERGLDNYVNHPSTKALLLAYAIDDAPVRVIELKSHSLADLPDELREALESPTTQKLSWNVPFEAAILRTLFDLSTRWSLWYDPMVHARYLTLPGSLAGCAEALNLPVRKDKRGKDLIRKFSQPTKSTKKQIKAGMPEYHWRDASTDPEDWGAFGEYCGVDVGVLREVVNTLATYPPLPENEVRLWRLDQAINTIGLPTDPVYVREAKRLIEISDATTLEEMKVLTGLDNPNSVEQVKKWLVEHAYPMESIAAESVDKAISDVETPADVKQVLRLRQKLGGAGPKKLAAIESFVSTDGRLRDQFTFTNSHTHRWGSRGVQVHNLPKPSREIGDRGEEITNAIRNGSVPEGLDISDAITSTIRSAIRAPEGKHLVVSDYSSIENRLLAWVAKCKPMLDVYRDKKDPYRAFAVKLFGKAYDEISKHERTMAKPAVLGCGYGMSWSRLQIYAAAMGVTIDEETARKHVSTFRSTYKEIKLLWSATEEVAFRAVRERKLLKSHAGLYFDGRDERYLMILLHSGTPLFYLIPKIETVEKEWGAAEQMTYRTSGKGGMVRETTHGAKLVENIIQALARDVLAEGLIAAIRAGFTIVGHVHDEIVTEADNDSEHTPGALEALMSIAPTWAPGLMLAAEGQSSQFYSK